MTNAAWLAADDPQRLAQALEGQTSLRKLRLFACACLRWLSDFPDDPTARRAVLAAERFADGALTADQLRAAFLPAWRYGWEPVRAAAMAAAGPGGGAYDVARLAWVAAEKRVRDRYPGARAPNPAWGLRPDAVWRREWAAAALAQAERLRDIAGDPSRPARVDPSWLARGGGTVRRLAEVLAEDGDFTALPVLADALEDAGCTDRHVLEHCRSPGPHVRGCWVVDAILGRA